MTLMNTFYNSNLLHFVLPFSLPLPLVVLFWGFFAADLKKLVCRFWGIYIPFEVTRVVKSWLDKVLDEYSCDILF